MRKDSSSSQKKPIWKWIPKIKNLPNQNMSSPYKQALLSYRNGNELEAQKGAIEAVKEDVNERLLGNSKIITQPLDNTHNH